jgi:hypothetical protein
MAAAIRRRSLKAATRQRTVQNFAVLRRLLARYVPQCRHFFVRFNGRSLSGLPFL